jgi:hypothetical protein
VAARRRWRAWQSRASAIAVALAMFLSTAPQGHAQADIPVTLRARTFRYDREGRILTAAGEVVVNYQDVTIRADRFRANLDTNDVRAEGSVVIQVGQYRARGEALDYNLTSRQGRIDQAAADYAGPMVLGTVRIRAALIQGVLDGPTLGRDAFCTTCEGPDPVAYLTARELRFYPNDKIIGRGVTVWIGGRRILTWPYFVIFLRQRQASRLLPVVGYSDLEGYFIKTFYSYALNPDQYGYLRLDLMERLGTGYGVEHAYRFGTASGTAFVYRLENKQTRAADYRFTLNHQQHLGDVTARLYGDYIHRSSLFGPTTDAFASLDAYYRGTAFSTWLYQSYSSFDFAGFASRTYTARLFHTHQLSSTLTGEITADVFRNSSFLGTDDELFPRVSLRYRGAGYIATLVAEGRIDMDGDRFPGDLRFVTERLPEVTVATDARAIGGTRLVYQLHGGVGRFREGQTAGVADAIRSDAGITLSGSLLESDRGFLSLRAETRAQYYSTGQARALVTGRADYTRYIGDAWTAQVGVTYQDQAGQSPFLFDRFFTRIAQGEASLTYRQPNLLVTANAAYDAAFAQWIPVVVRAQYAPRSDWAVAAALSYDPLFSSLSRAEVAFDIKISPLWQVYYYGFYDGFSRRVFHDRLTITRIWQECLATALTYRGTTNEIWVEAWLTALPWARGRIGVGSQGNILFDQPWLTPGP